MPRHKLDANGLSNDMVAQHPQSSQQWSDEDYSSEADSHWYMFTFKVVMCPKHFSHDWSACPFAHPNERARRRNLHAFKYASYPCPDMVQDGECERGESCPFAHNVYEYWLHPTRYRTQMCKNGTDCSRAICFFAHTTTELRFPELTPDEQLKRMAAKAARPTSPTQQDSQGPPAGGATTAAAAAAVAASSPPPPPMAKTLSRSRTCQLGAPRPRAAARRALRNAGQAPQPAPAPALSAPQLPEAPAYTLTSWVEAGGGLPGLGAVQSPSTPQLQARSGGGGAAGDTARATAAAAAWWYAQNASAGAAAAAGGASTPVALRPLRIPNSARSSCESVSRDSMDTDSCSSMLLQLPQMLARCNVLRPGVLPAATTSSSGSWALGHPPGPLPGHSAVLSSAGSDLCGSSACGGSNIGFGGGGSAFGGSNIGFGGPGSACGGSNIGFGGSAFGGSNIGFGGPGSAFGGSNIGFGGSTFGGSSICFASAGIGGFSTGGLCCPGGGLCICGGLCNGGGPGVKSSASVISNNTMLSWASGMPGSCPGSPMGAGRSHAPLLPALQTAPSSLAPLAAAAPALWSTSRLPPGFCAPPAAHATAARTGLGASTSYELHSLCFNGTPFADTPGF